MPKVNTKMPGVGLLLIIASSGFGQESPSTAKQTDPNVLPDARSAQVVVVTGARFSYKLVEKWIDEYNKVRPGVQIMIESRGSSDPLQYEILAEVFEPDDEVRKNREYVNVGRYAVLPVANDQSAFAKTYAEQGLDKDLINEIFFHNIFSEQRKEKPLQLPFTAYTRLQKAGVARVFAAYFGYEQKDLKGTAIAGADSHLLKAVLRDSTGVTYLPLPLIYDEQTRKPVEGLTVLPVDLNGNKKISSDEKIFQNLDLVIERLEEDATKIKNVPIEYLHLSIDRQHASIEAIEFLKWVNDNGQSELHHYGYLKPDPKHIGKTNFSEFSSQRGAHIGRSENK
jgi:phosphate transport system substrate-binding protein